jgi:hypothetical protein
VSLPSGEDEEEEEMDESVVFRGGVANASVTVCVELSRVLPGAEPCKKKHFTSLLNP